MTSRVPLCPRKCHGRFEKATGTTDRMEKPVGRGMAEREQPVFTTEQGRYLCNHSVYQAFKRIVKKLDLPNTRFHDLRHTYAVNSLRSGDDIKTVQENLGHHTAAFTLDVYAHVTAGMKKDSADRMEGYIQSIAV